MKLYLRLAVTVFFLLSTGYAFSEVPVRLEGEARQWHTLTLSFDGPQVDERDEYNPFLNYRMNVEFTHKQSGKSYLVPGFFAADANAANTSASAGNQWQVRFSPDELGLWQWRVSFRKGAFVAVSEREGAGRPAGFMHEQQGEFKIKASNKRWPDFRERGRLQWVNKPYLRFAGSGDYFIKAGPDSPENLLAYAGFDGDFHSDGHGDKWVKTWRAHESDWQKGDPTWRGDKGKGLIGALNYISSKGMNSISFLTLNILGDDKNVFPYLDYDHYDRLDVSKLEQWNIVFSHAQKKGLFLHFKTQEVENQGLLDGGGLGVQRRLYYRELIARFGHHLALNWNMGEENGDWVTDNPSPAQGTSQRLAMAQYFKEHDPYAHHIVIHNGVYFDDLRGADSWYTGVSLQTSKTDFSAVHSQAKEILSWPIANDRVWAVAVDEPGDAEFALVPDKIDSQHQNARQNGLWGALMAGAWGTEWYFGYGHEHSDLSAEDWRSRDLFWDQARYALQFFAALDVPYEKAVNLDGLSNDAWVLGELGQFYIVYVKTAEVEPRLRMLPGLSEYSIRWFDPRNGGEFQQGSKTLIKIDQELNYGWDRVEHGLGLPPSGRDADWLAVVKKR